MYNRRSLTEVLFEALSDEKFLMEECISSNKKLLCFNILLLFGGCGLSVGTAI